MEKLVKEYAEYLTGKEDASTKFWTLDARIKKDRKSPGVQLAAEKSNMVWDIALLIKDGVIDMEDLEDFSGELQEEVRRIWDGRCISELIQSSRKRGNLPLYQSARNINTEYKSMSNNRTINYYNENAEMFFQDTARADMSHLYRRFLPLIPAGGRILDLGCGSGRDSRYFIGQGFQVTAVDGSEELCRLASKYIGQEVLCMDFEDLAFENCFDGVWACASLLHVPRDSIKDILARIHQALACGGVLYASFKAGKGERIRGERFFNDYSQEDMEALFTAEDGWEICENLLTGDVREGREGEYWVNVVVRKNTFISI